LYPPTPENNGAHLAPLAKAFIQAGGVDPLRDHAIIYARALEEDWKAEVKLIVYGGYGHMFWTNWPLLDESKKFWKDCVSGIGWLLGQEAKSSASF
jgi:acetyl esterase/lipase